MTVHWRSLTADGRVEAIKAVWTNGASMRGLGETLGTTRSAIAGMYYRYGTQLQDFPLNGNLNRHYSPKPQRVPVVPIFESQGAGRTLMMLEPRHCKWPVNNAERGETHLFCGVPTSGSYCAYHASRSMAPSLQHPGRSPSLQSIGGER